MANCGCSTRVHRGTGLLRSDRGYRTARGQVGDWRRRRRRVHARKIPTFAGIYLCAGGGTRTYTSMVPFGVARRELPTAATQFPRIIEYGKLGFLEHLF